MMNYNATIADYVSLVWVDGAHGERYNCLEAAYYLSSSTATVAPSGLTTRNLQSSPM